MSRTFEDDQALAKALGGLSRKKTPRRDLWPGIAARLDDRPAAGSAGKRAWRAPALAASVAVAFVAGILLGQGTAVHEAADPVAGQAVPLLMTSIQASEREYQAAFRELAPIDIVPSMFDVQDVEKIQNSWSALQQAESVLLEALHQYPDNPFLGEKLLDLRAQQLEFMKQSVMRDQNSGRKI